MYELINKKEDCMTNWKKMPIEDKVFLVMEGICYLLAIGTLIATIFVINEGFTAAMILLFSTVGFVRLGLNARVSRDTHIGVWKLIPKMNNKKTNKLLKWN